MVPKSMIKSNALIRPVKLNSYSYRTEIVMPKEMMANSDYPKPKPFGRPSKKSSYDPTGYSDHLPISVYLEE
jgi:hypothetical protein